MAVCVMENRPACHVQVHWQPAEGRLPGSCFSSARQNSCSLPLKRSKHAPA